MNFLKTVAAFLLPGFAVSRFEEPIERAGAIVERNKAAYVLLKSPTPQEPTISGREQERAAKALQDVLQCRESILSRTSGVHTGSPADRHSAAVALNHAAHLSRLLADFAQARTYFHNSNSEIRALCNEFGRPEYTEHLAHALLFEGDVEYHLQNINGARQLFKESQTLYSQCGRGDGVAKTQKLIDVVNGRHGAA